jgi:protoheme IX farnesyltransferase
MLPVVASMERTTLEILIYSVVLAALAMLFGASAHLGALYAVAAILLNVMLLVMAARLYARARRGETIGGPEAMRLFHYSITYLTLLFVAMAADVLIRNAINAH